MAEAAAPVRVVIMGHSFVTRLQRFLQITHDISMNLNLSAAQCAVTYSGLSGGTVARFRSVQITRANNSDIVVLQIGSNDLCYSNTSTQSVVDSIIQLVHDLHFRQGVRHIIVMQMLKRHTPRNPAKNRFNLNVDWYGARVDAAHFLLTAALRSLPYATYWKHKGLFSARHLEAALSAMGYTLTTLLDIGSSSIIFGRLWCQRFFIIFNWLCVYFSVI